MRQHKVVLESLVQLGEHQLVLSIFWNPYSAIFVLEKLDQCTARLKIRRQSAEKVQYVLVPRLGHHKVKRLLDQLGILCGSHCKSVLRLALDQSIE